MKKALYMTTTGLRAGQVYKQISELVAKLVPHGVIEVTYPEIQQVKNERDAAIESLKKCVAELKKAESIIITDGCEECSSIWERRYSLKGVTDLLADLRVKHSELK